MAIYGIIKLYANCIVENSKLMYEQEEIKMTANFEAMELKALNELALSTSADFATKYQVVKKICQALGNDVLWGFAFSFSLFIQGGYDSFNDFDILLNVDDGPKILERLEKAGATILPEHQKGVFTSPFYREAYMDDIHIDLIGKCTINTFNTTYWYDVKKSETEWAFLANGIAVPVIPIEASLILYGMMIGWQANRKFKVELCVNYLKETKVKYPEIFEDAKNNFNLPSFLLEVIDSVG